MEAVNTKPNDTPRSMPKQARRRAADSGHH